MGFFASQQYTKSLFAVFILIWIFLSFNVHDVGMYLLENVLTVIVMGFFVLTYKKFRLSNVSYTLIFVYLVLHLIGAHYTYQEVPYDEWGKMLFGVSINEFFGWSRNMFDRLVHLCFGLLMAYPIREFFLRVVDVKGFWGYYLPFDVMVSFSALYEMGEWFVAVVAGSMGQSFTGMQGDEWDAQKDMALAIGGALFSMAITAIINSFIKDDFNQDMKRSLKVKHPRPRGEASLKRMRK